MGINYQAGLLNLTGAAPHFDTVQECVDWCRKMDEHSKETFGIWTGQTHGSDLLFIVHEGRVFE